MKSDQSTTIDRRSGFCPSTKIFHSLRPNLKSPPQSHSSITSYIFSLLLPPFPARPAFINATTGETLSFSELHSQSLSLAAALRLFKGDVAFILAPTCLEVPVLYLALLSIGVVVCPSSSLSTAEDVARQVRLVHPTVAFAANSTAHLLPPGLPVVLLDTPRFRSFLTSGGSEPGDDGDVGWSDTAVILFSSGTSGESKAVASTHRSHMEMIAGFHEIRGIGGTSPDVMLLVAPMFHSLGFFLMLKGVAAGDTTVVMSGRFSFPDILRTAEKYKVTKIAVAPPIIVLMSRSEEASACDLSSLRSIFTGGASVGESSARRFMARFPWVAIEQAYGSTEGGSTARMIDEEECLNYKSVGRLNQNTEAKIVDPISNESLPPGQQGELHLRSPSVMKGYLGDEVATSACLDSEGWVKTGDLCYFDEEGYLYIVDKLKELIKYKAYQVPPVELEKLLSSLPGVHDVAVVPYPNEEAGQIPMACIVRNPGSSIDDSEVMDFVGKRVAPYKKIRKVVFVNSIPKTPTGKILRRVLAKQVLVKGSFSRL